MTLFTRIFKDLSLTRKLWDLYILEGNISVLFQTAIAILRLLAEHAPSLWQDFEDILPTLKNAGEILTARIEYLEPLLVRCISEVQVPKWLQEEIPLLESEFYQQDLKFN